MRLVVIAVGRLKQGPERELAERYRERFDDIGRKLGFRGLQIHEIPESRAREAETRTEVEQDVCGLGDNQPACLEERRCVRRSLRALVVHEAQHRVHAAFASARHVDIVGAGFLERKPDELAAALDGRPVIELVAHGKGRRGKAPRLGDLH